MTAPVPVSAERKLGLGFDTMQAGLILVGAPPAVGKTCISLNLAAHYAGHLGEDVLYFSPSQPREVIAARLAKNLTPEGQQVDATRFGHLPLTVLDGPAPTSQNLLELATVHVEQHDQPGLVLVNDLQNLRPPKEHLSGLDATIAIMADMRALAEICNAPVVLLSQLSEGKSISTRVCEQADRVVTVHVLGETPDVKTLQVGYFDPPEHEANTYRLALDRSSGVLSLTP